LAGGGLAESTHKLMGKTKAVESSSFLKGTDARLAGGGLAEPAHEKKGNHCTIRKNSLRSPRSSGIRTIGSERNT